jgi:hypothetical protein
MTVTYSRNMDTLVVQGADSAPNAGAKKPRLSEPSDLGA